MPVVLPLHQAVKGLYLNVLVYFGEVHPKSQLLCVGLSLDPEQAENYVAADVTLAQLLGVLLLDLEADDLLVGLLLPVRIFTEDLLLEGGDMMVEEVGDIGGLLEERN